MPERYAVWPSSLAFLYEECKRCFYLDHVEGFQRPRTPFPQVFDRIDDAMKRFFEGRDVDEIAGELPPGTLSVPRSTLVSRPFVPGDLDVELFVRGRLDALAAFDEGGFGVVDFKTTERDPERLERYRPQLEAYAHALEHPAEGSLEQSPVTKLGLVCVEPTGMRISEGSYVFETEPTWHGVDRDPDGFLETMGDVADLLARKRPPMPARDCTFCTYRQRAQQTGL